jgi:hypothetical protein
VVEASRRCRFSHRSLVTVAWLVAGSLILACWVVCTPIADASGWSVQRIPGPVSNAVLIAVSCDSAGDCTAVGNSTVGTRAAFAERWDGSRWSFERMSIPNSQLDAVSCPSERECVAVGSVGSPLGGTLAVRWNGSKWSVQSTPRPGPSGFSGVSCASARACTAVGNRSIANGDQEPFAERWNGSRGQSRRSPIQLRSSAVPLGASRARLLARVSQLGRVRTSR